LTGAENGGLTVTALAFYQDLCLAGKLFTFFTEMADLFAFVSTIQAIFIAFFKTTVFVGLFAGTRMTLD
jgi:hypothetical protein